MKQMKGHFDDIKNEYVYEGTYHEFDGDAEAYMRFRKTLCAFTAAMGILVILGGFTMAGRMSATPSVLIPFVLSVIVIALCAYDVMRVLADGNMFKDKTVKTLFPAMQIFGILLALSSVAGLISSILVLVKYGPEGQAFPVVIYPVTCLLSGVIGGLFSYYVHKNANY